MRCLAIVASVLTLAHPVPVAATTPNPCVEAIHAAFGDLPPRVQAEFVHISYGESRGIPTVHSKSSWGCLGINWPVHRRWLRPLGVATPLQLTAAKANAFAARLLYNRDGLGPWAATR